MTKTILALLAVASGAARADVAVFRGTITDNAPGRRAAVCDVEIQLTYWPGMVGGPRDGGPPVVENLCPPHRSCTARQTCTRSTQFGLESGRVTIAKAGAAIDTWAATYPIQTITRAHAPIGATCSVEYPTVATPGDGGPVDVYVKLAELRRIHFVLQPRAVLDAASDPIAGYVLADVALATNANVPGHQVVDFTIEARPDVKHAWNATGGGWMVVDRVVRGSP